MNAKPCPICGEVPKIDYIPDDYCDFYSIECRNENCEHTEYFEGDTEEEVINKWNKAVEAKHGNL
jgi:hypothetical protein